MVRKLLILHILMCQCLCDTAVSSHLFLCNQLDDRDTIHFEILKILRYCVNVLPFTNENVNFLYVIFIVVNEFPVLKADAIKYVMIFRSQV